MRTVSFGRKLALGGLGAWLVCWGLIGAVQAADAPGVLPGDAIIHLRTGGLDKTINDVEAFVGAAVNGTPAMMMMQPGFIRQQLDQLTKLPKEMVDLNRSLEIVICNPVPDQEPAAAFLLPVSDFAGKLATLKAAGGQVEEVEKDVYKLPSIKEDLVLAAAGKDYVALGDKPEAVKHVAELFAGWQHEAPADGDAAPQLVATIDVAKIMTLNAPLMEMGLGMMDLKLQEVARAEGEKPANIKELTAFASKYVRLIRQFGSTVKYLKLYVYATGEHLRTSLFLAPMPETALARIAAAYEAEKPAYDLAKLLPTELAMAEAVNLPAAVLQEIIPFCQEMVRDLSGLSGAAGDPAYTDSLGKVLGSLGGEMAAGIYATADGQQASVTYLKLKDAAAFRAGINDYLSNAGGLINNLLRLIPDQPLLLKPEFAAEAGQAEGVPFSSFNMRMEMTEGGKKLMGEAAGAGGEPAQKVEQQLAALQDLFKRMGSYMAVLDDVAVGISGPVEPAPALSGAIKIYKGQIVGLGKRENYAKVMEAFKTKQAGLAMIYLLDAIRVMGGQALAANPMIDADMKDALKALPASTECVTLAMGASQGSLKLITDVPTKAISETAGGLMAAFMGVQMRKAAKANEAGGEVAPKAAPAAPGTF